MNDRIQELANQAGLFVDFNGQPWPKALSADECVAAYKQFAELIVKECIYQVSIDENGVAYEGAARIARYFGVE